MTKSTEPVTCASKGLTCEASSVSCGVNDEATISPVPASTPRCSLRQERRVLVPCFGQDSVREYDADGRLLWEAALPGPVSAERLPDGHTLVGCTPPRVVERERVIEHHYYYEPAPAYTERRVYVEPREYAYVPPAEVYVDRPYRYAYAGWRPRFFFPRGIWHRHHRW